MIMNRKQIMSMIGALPQHELDIMKEEYLVDIEDSKIKVENLKRNITRLRMPYLMESNL